MDTSSVFFEDSCVNLHFVIEGCHDGTLDDVLREPAHRHARLRTASCVLRPASCWDLRSTRNISRSTVTNISTVTDDKYPHVWGEEERMRGEGRWIWGEVNIYLQKQDILQHKSWHVWNRDNRAKVEKDVAAHKEVEEKKRKRVLEIVCTSSPSLSTFPFIIVHLFSSHLPP